MLPVNKMTRYQACRWLCRFDPEAKWHWLKCFLFSRANLKEDVMINLRDYGVVPKVSR